ncbi:MAG: hypothetical protein ACREFY_17205 [Acetobacteraceae bacterium]
MATGSAMAAVAATVPTREGVRLATGLSFLDGAGPVPVLMERMP